MESVGDGWQDEMQKYFRSVETLTEKSLKRIKQGRIRVNLPFDEPFMKYFLDRTKLRIAHAYTDFLCADRFEQQVNQQSYGSAGTSVQHPLASTIIGTESIEQMPIILVQSSHGNLERNNTASTTFAQDCSQIIFIPSNQLRSDPPGVGNNQSTDQETSAQSTDSIAVAPATENSKQMERFRTFLHSGTHLQNNKGRIAQTSEPTISISRIDRSYKQQSAGTPANLRIESRLGSVLSPGTNRDANSDQMSNDDTNGLDYEQEQDYGNESATADEISSKRFSETIGSNSGGDAAAKNRDEDDVPGNIVYVSGLLQPTINRRKRGNAMIGGHFPGNLKLASTVETKKWHKCNYCDYSARQKGDLTRHIRTHTNERPHKCKVCGNRFTLKQHLNVHMKTHQNLFLFQCSTCRQGFLHESKWKAHESRCKLKQFECFLCNKKCHQNKSHLLEHMRRKHTGEKPFGCSGCPKQFCHKSDLAKHTKGCELKGK